MASSDNRPSQSLINAAVASLVGITEAGTIGTAAGYALGMPIRTGFLASASSSAIFRSSSMSSSPSDLFSLYYSSMIPAVSNNGISIPRNTPQQTFHIDMEHLAPEFDYDFTKIDDGNKTFIRGNQPYMRPCGSYRIALSVKDKFGNDNTWLGMTGTTSGEWPVSYHGTEKDNAQTIAEDGFNLSKGKRFLFGKGIYSTPEVEVAKSYAAKFTHQGTAYKCILQNRVNPKYLKVIPASKTRNGTYWLSACDNSVVNESELIRPYGICLFKQN